MYGALVKRLPISSRPYHFMLPRYKYLTCRKNLGIIRIDYHLMRRDNCAICANKGHASSQEGEDDAFRKKFQTLTLHPQF